MNAHTQPHRKGSAAASAGTARSLASGIIALAIMCPLFAQAQVPPRFYWQSLAGANAVPVIFQSLSGNANPLDPAHFVSPDISGSVDANVLVAGYAKMLPLFDRTVTLAVLEPMGRISGDAIVDGAVTSQETTGFGDPMIEAGINLIGPKALRTIPDLLRYEPKFSLNAIVDLALRDLVHKSAAENKVSRCRIRGHRAVQLLEGPKKLRSHAEHYPMRTILPILALCGLRLNGAFAADTASTIYHGGPVITINDAAPRAEAVAVKDGKIMAVGKKDDVLKTKGANTKLVDLAGRTILPGFVDAHGHVFGGGIQALSANLLAPPDGEVRDITGLQQTLRDWIAANKAAVDKIQLVVGFGYDNVQLAELRHPTRDDLDAVSKELPVIIIHQSGHLAAANSKALEIGGITAATPEPDGGVIQRREGSNEPNGVLEETASFPLLMKLLGRVGPEGALAFFRAGTELWARFGYTTAQEGRSTPGVVKAMQTVADSGGLKIDVTTYPDVLADRDLIKNSVSPTYRNRFRVAGAKLTIDGSPQGFTAWRDRPYYKPVGNYPPGYVGYPAAKAEQVRDAIDWAFANNIQIITHCNGEAASDQLIACIGAAGKKHGAGDRRPVLIHGQFLREDQVDSLNTLGIVPSLFPMHTFYWGDWHREHTVGPVLAENISPTGWCLKRGMKFTSHHDAPVAFPDSMRVLDATVSRRTRSGDILGPQHRVDVMTALKAMTLWPAWQHFEEKTKGSIEVGKLADLIILDKDPSAIDPETIDQVKVVETIKEGVTIFGIASMKKAGGSICSSAAGELAFARAMAATASHLGHHHGHRDAHGVGCLCGAMSQLAAIIAGAEEK